MLSTRRPALQVTAVRPEVMLQNLFGTFTSPMQISGHEVHVVAAVLHHNNVVQVHIKVTTPQYCSPQDEVRGVPFRIQFRQGSMSNYRESDREGVLKVGISDFFRIAQRATGIIFHSPIQPENVTVFRKAFEDISA